MALQPVSGVTPLNRGNNVSFSGENRKPHSGMQPIASSAKAVPLAVLIAMSPLNKSVATDNGAYINPEPPRTEVTESTGFLFPKNRLVKAIDKKPSDIFMRLFLHKRQDQSRRRRAEGADQTKGFAGCCMERLRLRDRKASVRSYRFSVRAHNIVCGHPSFRRSGSKVS